MRGKLYALLAGVFYALGVVQVFSGFDLGLPFYQLENAILLAIGAAFLIAFFRANQPRPVRPPPEMPPPAHPLAPLVRGKKRRRRRPSQ